MGFHDVAVMIRTCSAKDPPVLLSSLGFTVAEEVKVDVEGDNIYFSPEKERHVNACLSGDWSMIWGDIYPPVDILLGLERQDRERYKTLDFLHEKLANISAGTQALAFVVESTSGTYGFDWFENGTLRRSYWEIGCQLTRNEGAPLIENEHEFIHQLQEDESALFPLFERLTLPFDVAMACHWRLFRLHWRKPEKKTPWWRLW